MSYAINKQINPIKLNIFSNREPGEAGVSLLNPINDLRI